MKEYTLSCREITTRKEFHQAIAELMDFPDYYGNNLDALMDVLTDICEDTVLILTGCSAMETALGTYYQSLKRVFKAANRENEAFNYQMID